MTEDRIVHESDLHLLPEKITDASKKVADLYQKEVKVFLKYVDPYEGIVKTILRGKGYGKRKTEWVRVAEKSSLEAQIMGLRSALNHARELEDRFSTEQIEAIANPLTRDITFTDLHTKAFLEDIYISRILVDGNPRQYYSSPIFLQEEADNMRNELGLEEGVCKITLEQAVRAVLTSRLSLTRQTDSPSTIIS